MAEPDTKASTSPATSQSRRLDSWKEIAAYLSRDVTTVRRWEKREGLPVHRHRHAALGSVYAFTSEIDAWRSGRDQLEHRQESASREDVEPIVVGREQEIRRLHAHLHHARGGARRTVFISGELGIGKTSLVRAFLHAVKPDVWIAVGQCVEQYGRGEPYLPVVEGLGRLVRDSRDREASRVVEHHAPSWLDSLSGSSGSHRHTRPVRNPGSNSGQMPGELTHAIEALTAVKPLVLVLEDLHWSDHSTIELIARLGRRPDQARLLVIGTYRLAELVDVGSPLLRVCRELRAHFQADEIELTPLNEEAIAQFIARDRKWGDLQDTAARLKHWSGNPLFIVHLLEHLQSCGRLFERNGGWTLDLETAGRAFVPDKLRMLVEDQVDRLGLERRRLLEIAGVVGGTFTAALVAHAARQDVTDVERQFEDLCKRSHLLRRREEARLPDGTSSASYAFVHEFYRQVVYERLPAATLTELHHAIGGRLENGYGDRGSEIASELATHFELGHDVERAAGYYATAAENALARNADREAQIAVSRAAELVARLAPGDARDRREAHLLAQLDVVFTRLSRMALWLKASPFGQILDLPRADRPSALLGSIVALSLSHAVSGDVQAATEIGERAVAIARVQRRGLFDATVSAAFVRLLAGNFATSLSLASGAITTGDGSDAARSNIDRSLCQLIIAWSAWCLGRYEDAQAALERILASPVDGDNPAISTWIAPLLEWLGETDRSVALLGSDGAVTKPSRSQDGGLFTGAVHGWIGVRRRRFVKGLAILEESVEAQRRLGLQAWLPLALSWLAEGLLLNAKADAARAAAEEGLQVVRRTGVRCWDSELYRLRGEAMISPKRQGVRAHNLAGDRDAAEASFWAAISVAREQDARTFELRATLSLARLLLESGRQGEAVRTLAPVSETFDRRAVTPDLVEARTLLLRYQSHPH
jgi:tetratricopeptide (TPR) repeat protein